MKNLVIWALFDDAKGCWNQLNLENVFSIGINENKNWKNYYQIDISITNKNLLKQFEKLPKPDVIIAHPPCESWSLADNQRRLLRKIDYLDDTCSLSFYSYFTNQINNLTKSKNLKRDYYKQWATTINGITTIIAVFKIIEYFKPKVFVIENPQTSLLWTFIKKMFLTYKLESKLYENDCYYNCYDDIFSKKPTRFLSNLDLNLKKENIKSTISLKNVSGYSQRAAIPQTLLLEIYNKIIEKLC